MTLSPILDLFITQQSISPLRVKELLLFLLGYAFNQLGQFSTHTNQTQMKTNLHQIVNELTNLNAKGSYIVNKQNLSRVFQVVLNTFQEEKKTIKDLQLTFQELIELFLQILTLGLRINKQTQSFQNENSQLRSCIQKEIRIKAKKFTLKNLQNTGNNKHQQICDQFHKPSFNASQCQDIRKKVEDLCEICQCSLNNVIQQDVDKRQIVQINQCGHEYHRKCIMEMIAHYMNENSSILYQGKQTQKNKAVQAQKDCLTSIKCPGYEKCSVHVSFSELHHILLNEHSQKGLKYLQRLYSMAFNDYINSQNIMSFQQGKKYILGKSKDQEDYKSFNSLTRDSLFFCYTKGCNAIYEINQDSIMHSPSNKSFKDQLQNFTCLSCHESYCLKCFSPIHPTMTCKEFAISSSYLPEDRQLQKFIKTLRRPYMKCPKCHFYVDNWRGCSTITCRCGIRFCYKCGSTQCPYAKCLKEMAKQGKINQEKYEQQN